MESKPLGLDLMKSKPFLMESKPLGLDLMPKLQLWTYKAKAKALDSILSFVVKPKLKLWTP
jgi:hypothetical protein